MKSVFQFLFLFVLFFSQSIFSQATTYTITASNSQFTQDFDSIIVGDTVKWVWVEGIHTTTSNGIPAGAETWSVELNQFNTSFTYVIKFGGTYNYISVPDAPLMGGSFVASYPVGISAVFMPAYNFNLISNPSGSNIEYSFALSKNSLVNISLFSLTGTKVQELYSGVLPDGFYHQSFSLNQNISPGLYFVTLRIGEAMITKRMVIQ